MTDRRVPAIAAGRTVVACLLVLSAVVALPAGTASAQECSLDATEFESLVGVYNANLDRIPSILRGQVTDQRIDVRVDTPAGERRFAVATDSDGRITTFEEASAGDPTLRVTTSESTVCDIVTASDPAATATEAYENGDIEFSGVGIGNSLKVVVAKIVKALVDLLSGFF